MRQRRTAGFERRNKFIWFIKSSSFRKNRTSCNNKGCNFSYPISCFSSYIWQKYFISCTSNSSTTRKLEQVAISYEIFSSSFDCMLWSRHGSSSSSTSRAWQLKASTWTSGTLTVVWLSDIFACCWIDTRSKQTASNAVFIKFLFKTAEWQFAVYMTGSTFPDHTYMTWMKVTWYAQTTSKLVIMEIVYSW